MIIHDITSLGDWERAMADPDAALIRIAADIDGPLVYTGPGGSPERTVLITSVGGRVFCPKYPRGAIEIPGTARYVAVGSTPSSPRGWAGSRRPRPLGPGFTIRDEL